MCKCTKKRGGRVEWGGNRGATGSRLVTFEFRRRATTLQTTVETQKSHAGQTKRPRNAAKILCGPKNLSLEKKKKKKKSEKSVLPFNHKLHFSESAERCSSWWGHEGASDVTPSEELAPPTEMTKSSHLTSAFSRKQKSSFFFFLDWLQTAG